MSTDVAVRLAKGLTEYSGSESPIILIWHGGEPLSCGVDHLTSLLEPFERLNEDGIITHAIQTNATLIDEDWCRLFKKYDINVSVSIDGPAWANEHRVDWGDKDAFGRIMKGIKCLRKNSIDFNSIAVVNGDQLDKAPEIYDFFCHVGCRSLGINIEEYVGVNENSSICDSERVKTFWKELFESWKSKPDIRIREFDHVLSYMGAVCKNQIDYEFSEYGVDIFPTVGWNGDIVVLSPEFLGIESSCYENFVVGNILENSLREIICSSTDVDYVRDFILGVQKCKEECAYFTYCGGGQASNKYFELGSTKGTETKYCRNSKKRLSDAILSKI